MSSSARHFIMLVVFTVVAVGVLMAPRRDEWFAIMRDEDKQAQIIELLEPRLARNPYDADALATAGRSYAELGNHRRAAELLQRYIAIRPDDGEAYAQLADVYKHIGDRGHRIAMLQHSLSLKPNVSRAMELAGLYRDDERLGEELALLSQYESELTLESGLLLRLAKLHVARGERSSAFRVLMRPDVLDAPKQPIRGQDERLYLASLLIDDDRSAEAVRLGKQWIRQWREPYRANQLLQSVALRAPAVAASELAEAVALQHPELRFFLTNELAQMGADPIADVLLVNWSAA